MGGDIITKVDGMITGTLADLYAALEDNKPGEQIEIEVVRSGTPIVLSVTLAQRDEVISQ